MAEDLPRSLDNPTDPCHTHPMQRLNTAADRAARTYGTDEKGPFCFDPKTGRKHRPKARAR